MKILFSCVSGVDPFTIKKPTKDSNLDSNIVLANDGSMIRLVRYLHKHGEEFRVVLFLTDAFSKQAKEDVEKNVFKDKNGKALDRYTWGIRQISETIQVDFIHTNIVDANKMDKLSELTEEVLRLREENLEKIIIFNTSSGTAQMQTVLHLTARDMENTEQYQLDNPNYNKNQWENLKPNEVTSEMLLQVGSVIKNEDVDKEGDDPLVHKLNLTFIKKYTVRHELEKLVTSYQYKNAFELCSKEEYRSIIPENVKKLIAYANKKQLLLFDEADRLNPKLLEYVDSYFVIKQLPPDLKNIVEYLMLLDIHQKKNEFIDFTLKAFPLLVEIIKIPFLDLLDYEDVSKNPEKKEEAKFDKDKLGDKYVGIWEYRTYGNLKNFLSKDDFDSYNKQMGGGIYITFIQYVFSVYLKSIYNMVNKEIRTSKVNDSRYAELAKSLLPLRNIEQKFRNSFAHKIITDLSERDLVLVFPFKTMHEIYVIIYEAVKKLLMLKNKSQIIVAHNVYDILNDIILRELSCDFRNKMQENITSTGLVIELRDRAKRVYELVKNSILTCRVDGQNVKYGRLVSNCKEIDGLRAEFSEGSSEILNMSFLCKDIEVKFVELGADSEGNLCIFVEPYFGSYKIGKKIVKFEYLEDKDFTSGEKKIENGSVNIVLEKGKVVNGNAITTTEQEYRQFKTANIVCMREPVKKPYGKIILDNGIEICGYLDNGSMDLIKDNKIDVEFQSTEAILKMCVRPVITTVVVHSNTANVKSVLPSESYKKSSKQKKRINDLKEEKNKSTGLQHNMADKIADLYAKLGMKKEEK